MTDIDCHLYLISPSSFALDSFAKDLRLALSAGGVQSFQLRMKDAVDHDIRAAIELLMPICHEYDVAFIVNDRADIAAEMHCDGVHLGQGDGDIKEARALIGHDAIIGVTCHDSIDLGYQAAEASADYVAFGAFFPTNTKETYHQPEPEVLAIWCDATEIPVVAIGGITAENALPLIEAGANFLAVSGYVWQHASGPKAAVQALNDTIANAAE